MRIHGWIIVLALVLSGCKKRVDDTNVMPTTKESRLEFVESKSTNLWEWKILRDKKTKKEWLIIHDRTRMVVVPFDSKEIASTGLED